MSNPHTMANKKGHRKVFKTECPSFDTQDKTLIWARSLCKQATAMGGKDVKLPGGCATDRKEVSDEWFERRRTDESSHRRRRRSWHVMRNAFERPLHINGHITY